LGSQLARRLVDAGAAPRLPTGHDPAEVAERIVAAVTGDDRDLPASAFGPASS